MRLTRAAEYAIRCVLYLSQQARGALVSRQEIARQADIPPHFLAKIAQDLAKAGVIEIRQGVRGGFVLNRHPAAINLLEVVETMIGEIYLNDCVVRPLGCKDSSNCAVHQVWLQARDQLRASLRQVNFEQLTGTSCLSPSVVPPAPEAPEMTTSNCSEGQ
ncbi:MAG: Rrf2 family transcriptional regulator [Desulfobulbus sp.]|nr:Rrf2 family transcriptional regulator [Desulfobulbus sp.]